MRCTCHQRDQLVSPLGTQARIIICMRLEIGDDFLVGFIGFCIYKLIEFKAVLRYIVHSVPKGCDHLIGALLIFQVQQNFRVVLPLFLQIGQKPHDLGLLLRLGTDRSLGLPLRRSGGLHRRLRLRSRCPGGLCIALLWPLQLLFRRLLFMSIPPPKIRTSSTKRASSTPPRMGTIDFLSCALWGFFFRYFGSVFMVFLQKGDGRSCTHRQKYRIH